MINFKTYLVIGGRCGGRKDVPFFSGDLAILCRSQNM